MKKITDIINSIVDLGEENNWFDINISGLTPYDYITSKGPVITIDTSCLKAYTVLDPYVISPDELDDYLREMIEVSIIDADKFQIKIENNYI